MLVWVEFQLDQCIDMLYGRLFAGACMSIGINFCHSICCIIHSFHPKNSIPQFGRSIHIIFVYLFLYSSISESVRHGKWSMNMSNQCLLMFITNFYALFLLLQQRKWKYCMFCVCLRPKKKEKNLDDGGSTK